MNEGGDLPCGSGRLVAEGGRSSVSGEAPVAAVGLSQTGAGLGTHKDIEMKGEMLNESEYGPLQGSLGTDLAPSSASRGCCSLDPTDPHQHRRQPWPQQGFVHNWVTRAGVSETHTHTQAHRAAWAGTVGTRGS